jgi:hypothetical protein
MNYVDTSARTTLDNPMPPSMSPDYWGADTVAAFLDMKPREFKERYAPHPDFPKAHRFPRVGGGYSNPRWLESDIREWAATHRDDYSGRRRTRQ